MSAIVWSTHLFECCVCGVWAPRVFIIPFMFICSMERFCCCVVVFEYVVCMQVWCVVWERFEECCLLVALCLDDRVYLCCLYMCLLSVW